MFRRPHSQSHQAPDRRGAILIVVLALLAMFAVVGIVFVYYSDGEATSARIAKTTESPGDSTQPDYSDSVNRFLGTIIFDARDDDATGLLNALRGHGLSRTIYGWQGVPGQNMVPFNGVGTFHGATGLPAGVPDRAYIVNHTVIGGNVYDPEWTLPRNSGQLGALPATVGSNQYIPKNAPYTYPDANNLFLAAISPQTGEVVLQSFYRPWQFRHATQPATATGLEPTNPNWRQSNPQGRYLILRPRPEDNMYNGTTEFPYPPANADVDPVTGQPTYTGDVQNLPGGYFFNGTQFVARNDSIWIDIGLPPRQWNGKWIKPLVAALVLDLDGRVNLSAHGNSTGGAHVSYAGYGPWEVNPSHVLGNADTTAIIAGRLNGNPLQSRSGANSRSYATSYPMNTPTQLPAYSLVNWSGVGGGTIQLPSGATAFTTTPTYTGGFSDNATAVTNHPALFNPSEWPTTQTAGLSRTFPGSDLRRLTGRFAADLEFYRQTDLAKLATAPNPPHPSLIGTATPGNNYRLDPAHRNRLSVTTFGATLDVPGFMPGGTSTFQLTPPAGPTDPATRFPTYAPPGSGQYAPGSMAAAIGAVDLNRPLADYRSDTTASLTKDGNVTLASAQQAQFDRQRLARDIFARLVAATGGAFTPNVVAGTVVSYTNAANTVTIYATAVAPYQPGDVQLSSAVTPGTPQYDALRYLAQLAANIVDYIDNDDINTTFAWNAPDPTNPLDPATLPALITSGGVVFGVEKPRLVINEAYSEMTNDPMEMTMGAAADTAPTNPAHVRFWIELVNPTSTPYAAVGNGPLGDGAADLRVTAGYNPYRLQIYKDGQTASLRLQQAANVTGNVGTPAQIEYDFSATNAGAATRVMPNNGTYDATGDATKGVVVVGPTIPAPVAGAGPQTFEFQPTAATAGPWATNMIQAQAQAPVAGMPLNAMHYTVPIAGTVNDGYLNNPVNRRHLVVLQRLANPYLPPNDPSSPTFNATLPVNPYITVDYMDGVWTADAMNRLDMQGMPRMEGAGGYNPWAQRFAVGKVQPYAGFANPTMGAAGSPPTYQFPNGSFVLDQRPDPAVVGNQPRNTFGRHNGTTIGGPGNNGLPTTPTETLMSPYHWLVHMDRPLGNQLELLHVTGVKPHQLTQDYVRQDDPANPASYGPKLAQAPWFGSDQAGNIPGYDTTTNQTNNGLYRALDLLRVKPWGYGVPLGGKVHGRININTIQDRRVLYALLDPQATSTITTTQVDNIWNTWIGSRTRNISTTRLQADGATQVLGGVPVPGMQPTYDDAAPSDMNRLTYDRPFKPFGASEFIDGTFTSASGLEDTILRRSGQPQPLLWPDPATVTHPYQQAEAARKLLNNTTTVSNTFVVYFTVGYFEVRTDTTGAPVYVDEAPGMRRAILGKEVYKEVPGDLRQQFVAVIDRNNLTVQSTDPMALANATVNATYTQVGPRPFFTTLEAPATMGATQITIAAATDPTTGRPAIFSDGVALPLQLGTILVVGSGADQEAVAVSTATPAANGVSTVTLATGLQYPRAAGTTVANVAVGNAPLTVLLGGTPTPFPVPRLGNPGPQANFDVLDTNPDNPYRRVVPYWAKTR